MKHHYIECDLCHALDSNGVQMFTYDYSNKEKYIIGEASHEDDSEAVNICVNCIKRIKEYVIPEE